MDSQSLTFNGINGLTGQYLFTDLSVADISRIALGEHVDQTHLLELKRRYESSKTTTFGPIEEVDPTNLEEAGWGVVFEHGAEPALREALRPLLEHRRIQAGQRYREFWGSDGYRPGESKSQFLARHGQGPGPVDPDLVPYYLLLVGDPELIPYRFQQLLDVQFAVGRISFDTVADYSAYAQSVVRAEAGDLRRDRRAVFFGVRNQGDRATQISADELVAPLAQKIAEKIPAAADPGWNLDVIIGEDAQRARLLKLLGGEETPRLLFTASHGMGYPCGHPLQRANQGALLCQDWPGPFLHHGPIPSDYYLGGEAIDPKADLTGLIAFFFACFGGGTPRLDAFAHQAIADAAPIAPKAFVAALPQRLLSQSSGGALAVVAHVERAWGYSFSWPGAGPQLHVFESTLERLLKGVPLGHALEFFNTRYAELATEMSTQLEDAKFGATPDDLEVADLWTALNDSRNYVIIGDPAVRLR